MFSLILLSITAGSLPFPINGMMQPYRRGSNPQPMGSEPFPCGKGIRPRQRQSSMARLYSPGLTRNQATALYLAIDQIIPVLLTLASAVFFLLAVRGIAHRTSPVP